MEIIKTDPKHFKSITDYPYPEKYVDFENMQMHYLDEGAGETILAFHGEPSWSYLYRKFIPVLKDFRFVAPDLIGFGKSDKIVGFKNYSFDLHFRSVVNFMEKLDLQDITLVVQDWGGLLGLSLLGKFPERFKRVVILNTFLPIGKPLPKFFKAWVKYSKYHLSLPVGKIIQRASFGPLTPAVIAAYDAPFPTKKYKAGAASFPSLVPGKPSDGGVEEMKVARKVLSEWQKPSLILFSDKDKILGGMDKFFLKIIPDTENRHHGIIKDAGHFLQEEKGEEIAERILEFINSTI